MVGQEQDQGFGRELRVVCRPSRYASLVADIAEPVNVYQPKDTVYTVKQDYKAGRARGARQSGRPVFEP